jgi:phosphoribosyl 1,2-cyclic phosphate phosphodiesterase
MKITVLGCGSAGGVPLIGNKWGTCDPANPRNRRTRPSVLVEEGDTTILIDTSPDMRQQLLACNLQKLTAVLYTHAHADHCHGIDDLRAVNWLKGASLPIYADADALHEIKERFRYIFDKPVKAMCFTRPSLEPIVITGPFTIGPLNITPFEQHHGDCHSTGFRLNDFAYSTDVNELDEPTLNALKGVKVWVVGCIREAPHPSHAELEQVLAWVERVKPERAFLTHMDQSMDYETLTSKLPPNVAPAHDGLVIEC